VAADASRRPALLLLEDDLQLRSAMFDNLSMEFELEVASNVEEALLLLTSRRFDVLLCDQMMPGKKQGLDFLMEAQRQQPAARRILVTGYINPELLSRSVALAGLHACLLKPVAMPELRKTLHTVLGLDA
jgi:response regulator RpfG family c-di-GMP phosphodiesterase